MGHCKTTERFTVDGTTFDLELRSSDRRLYVDRHPIGEWHEFPLTPFFLSACRNAQCMLDVGAHIGWYSCLAGRANSGCSIIAFEPCTTSAAVLRRNLALNRIPRSTVVVAAVGRGGGRHGVLRPGVTTMESSLGSDSDVGEQVQVVSLDEWCSAFACSPDVVKVDVEGGELQVLLGMADTLRRYRPQLFIEVHGQELGTMCSGLLEAARYSVEPIRLSTAHAAWCNEVLWAAPTGT